MPPTAIDETVTQTVADLKLRTATTPVTAATTVTATPARKPTPQWFGETGLPESAYPYAHLLPTFNPTEKYAPLEPFEHVDPGLQALSHPNPREFLEGADIDDLTPEFGSDVSGIQLSALDDRARAQVALYVAQRGVVAFRDQDFIDKDPEWQVWSWGQFFGRPHIHPTSGQAKGYPHLHLVYRDNIKSFNDERTNSISSVRWHSDVTYEKQPPGLTALFLYDSPPTGGDTAFANQRAAYERLSPSFRSYLETLSVVHSAVEQAERSRHDANKAGGIVRREPVENVHPLVRRHPVTGDKALFVNRGFCRRIVGLKDEESTALLEFLFNHIERGTDFHIRARWRPRTVVLWDNRITAHSALVDFASTGKRRHGARVTPQAEVPFI